MKKQLGYTLYELIFTIISLLIISGIGFGIYLLIRILWKLGS